MINWKKYLQRTLTILLIPLSLTLCLVVLELLLEKTNFFDGEETAKPVYIPLKFKLINQKINEKNRLIASQNRHGFTDVQRQFSKEKGKIRIAVLGDSFIFGDGVPYDTIWSHKLEKELLDKYENVEILSWGQNGWSTQNQYRFLKNHGIKVSY